MSAKYYVTGAGHYIGAFSGANPPAGAVEVPKAPRDAREIWDGEKFALNAAAINADENARITAELLALDMASIRSIREYIASKPDAPQILKDREAAAVAARAGLR